MKKIIVLCAMTLGLAFTSNADIITLWNFNSPVNDATFTTGTLNPAMGSGTLTNIGGTTNSFGNPPSGAQSATSDPESTDDSGLRLGQFPAVGVSNKTAGIEFFVNTVGFEGIKVVFDQENSATASKYWRTQYTTNGTIWNDYIVLESAGSTSWLNGREVDFSTVAGVKNNPNFGFRYVSEWVSTATGVGADVYTPNSGASYGTGGTIWFDYVTVSGTVLSTNNTDPTITVVSNQTVRVNQATADLPFIVGDAETPVGSLTVSAVASNPNLFSSLALGGSGANRTVTVTPAANQSGFSMVTLTVTDAGGKGASSIFSVTVLPPTIIASNQTLRVNTSRTTGIEITQFAGFLGPVTVTADAVDGTLLPPGSLVLTGSGSNRNLTITPATNEMGPAIITVSATDGALTASATIFLNVVPSNTVAFWNFNSELRDFDVSTGTTNSNIGNGIATPLVAIGTFGTVGSTSDLDGQDNSRLRLGTFPAQGTGDKTGGVEFRFSTTGFQDIEMSFEHYNSATASRYWVIQYTTDGVNFTDAVSYTNLLVTTFFPVSASLTNLAGANNNPNFAVRIVSEFESSAFVGGTNGYVGVTNTGNYSSGGTLWLDTVKFTGNPFTGVTQATLSISLSGNNVVISWSDTASGTLESTGTVTGTFAPVSQTPVQANGKFTVTIPATGDAQFFRLHQ